MFIAILLILATTVYRLAMGFASAGAPDWLHNFAPFAAIALCGGFYLSRRLAFIVPPTALLASDVVLNIFRYGGGVFYPGQWLNYAALMLVAFIGFSLARRTPALPWLLGGSIVGSVLFYLITSTGAWWANPVYAKTAAGWIQAITIGDPAVTPPAWVFFRNSAVSDLLYTGLFFTCMSLTQQKAPGANPVMSELPRGSAGLVRR